jgi:hypothetical protein
MKSEVWVIVAFCLALAGGIIAAIEKSWAVVLVAAAAALLAAVQVF